MTIINVCNAMNPTLPWLRRPYAFGAISPDKMGLFRSPRRWTITIVETTETDGSKSEPEPGARSFSTGRSPGVNESRT